MTSRALSAAFLIAGVLGLAGCVSTVQHAGEARVDTKTTATLKAAEPRPLTLDVRFYGAKGDGKTTDTASINKAIEAAAAGGGGTVYFPAGTYLSFSIRLKSNVALFLDHGATILAAVPSANGAYDIDPPNKWGDELKYQDLGHTHWRNSLIWGENLHDISILGSGTIDGRGLIRGDSDSDPGGNGTGNKILGLKLCRNVTIRGVTMVNGGHFCILPTGVDNLIIDGVKFDTNRDAINIDCCKNVVISNCIVNSPRDDGIVLKSSFGLGYARATENVTIANCQVMGYDTGTMIDGTYRAEKDGAYPQGGTTGRIKLGTESNGGFKNITITNCTFVHCRGLAIEEVDGGALEDITISNITMREITNAPLFIRLGSRNRGPAGVPTGTVRRINISNIVAYDCDPRYDSMIMGIPGHDIEDVNISNVRILFRGGETQEHATRAVPELEADYPEPSFFTRQGPRGSTTFLPMPAYGFFIRHVKGIRLSNVQVGYMKEDLRPAFILDDVKDADFFRVESQKGAGAASYVLNNVDGFKAVQCRPIEDVKLAKVDKKSL